MNKTRTRFQLLALGVLLMVLVPPSQAERPQYPQAKHGGTYMYNYYLPPAPSTTPWWPSWSPDGKSIAVAMYGSIWKVDPSGGAAEELTSGEKYHSSPDWSPDGKWIVYTADDDGYTIQLEIVNIETGRSHTLTADKYIYADPVFSPDGTRVAYVSSKPNGYFNIYVRSIRNGQWAGEEIALTQDNSYGKRRLYFGEWDMHTQPTWMPSGEELVLVSNRNVPLGSGHLWRVPAKPNAMMDSPDILREQTLYRTRPDVSHDGKRLIYSSTRGTTDQYSHLYVLPTTGGQPYKLTFGDHDNFHPRFSPDGEWIAFISNQGGLPQLWLLETYGGAQKKMAMSPLRWKGPTGKVNVRVRDAQSGKLTAARIYGLATDGKFYAPAGSYSRFTYPRMARRTAQHAFHTEGEFTLEVPAGNMAIEAVKGMEYWPDEKQFEVKAGETTDVVLTVRPMVDMADKGWFNSSFHSHMNYGGNLRNTLENMMMMGRAEDMDLLNIQIANKDNRILDWQHFVKGGGEHPVSRDDSNMIVIIGEEYRPPFWGHVNYMGLKDHLISPFTTGYEGTGIESLYPSNTDMARKARAQGAVVGYAHSLGGSSGFPVDMALETVDGNNWTAASKRALRVWHHALNNDFRVTPLGGTDANTSLHRHTILGSCRTYAYMGEDFSAQSWLDALKAGQTFFTNGPLLEFQVNGLVPGEALRLPASGDTVTMEASLWSIIPSSRFVIYRNGEIWREIPLSKDRKSAHFKEEIKLTESGWYSLTAEGDPAAPDLDPTFAQAATNAIRVYVGDGKIRNRESAEFFIQWVERVRERADGHFGWRSDAEKTHVLSQLDEAEHVYRQRAKESAGNGETQ